MTSLDPLFAPNAIAVLGASRQAGKLGWAMARQLGSFPGPVMLVNTRSADPAAGVYSDVAAAAAATGVTPDLAVACLPAALTCDALAEAARAGCRAAVVCSGGFAEIGGEGAALQTKLAAMGAETGMRLLGPNTSGFIVPGRPLIASFVRGAERVERGTVGVVTASGGVNHAVAFALTAAGVGVEVAVGLGNGADIGTADVLMHLAASPTLTCIALHVETVPDGTVLLDAVAYASERLPVVALVVGRSDVGDFARSHTGALATSWRTTRALLRQAGAVLVADERELVDAVSALAMVRLPVGCESRVGLITGQAGPGLLLADGLRSADVPVPPLSDGTVARLATLLPPLTYQRNPVDTGRPSETFGEVLSTVTADPGVDVTVVYGLLEPDAVDLGACIAASAGTAPTVAVLGGLTDDVRTARTTLQAAGVPTLDSPAAAVRALVALRDDARAQTLRQRARADATSAPGPARLRISGRPHEFALKALLQAAGVEVPPGRVCADRQSAQAALAEIGGAVVVKVLEPVLDHKSDVGGVHLGVRTEADMDRAMTALSAIGATSVLIEAMIPGPLELIVGAHRDPVFGPVVLIGVGGVIAEVAADVAVRRLPVGNADVTEMASELALGALLSGYRGSPPVHLEELAHLAAVVGQVVCDNPGVDSFEINPVRLTAEGGLVALDASLTLTTQPS